MENDTGYINAFLMEFQGESDRGAALVGASFLDQALLDLLKSHFIDVSEAKELLEGGSAPLGTFSARIKAAYCLGLIGKEEHRELTLVRKVRNAFAHRLHDLTFESKEIKSVCGHLYDWSPSDNAAGSDPLTARSRFVRSVALMSVLLLERDKFVASKKIQPGSWSISRTGV